MRSDPTGAAHNAPPDHLVGLGTPLPAYLTPVDASILPPSIWWGEAVSPNIFF